MTDWQFLQYPLLGGIGIALITGPLGSIMIWRRLAFIGDMLAHATLLGVGIALWLQWSIFTVIFLVCILSAILMAFWDEKKGLATDTILGVISQTALASGVIITSMLDNTRIDLMAYLFGDILSISKQEVWFIYILVVMIFFILKWIWRALVLLTLHEDLAKTMGYLSRPVTIIYLLLLALTIALAMRLVGVLLVTALLIIPASTARLIARSPEYMVICSGLLGVLSVSGGLKLSLDLNWPSGPSIVLFEALLLLVIGGLNFLLKSKNKKSLK